MLKLFKSNRCQSCYNERAMRQCPRKKKNICWQCCNETRCDTHCPDSCPYSPKRDASNPFPCLLYTSDAADDLLCVDIGGRRIIIKKTTMCS